MGERPAVGRWLRRGWGCSISLVFLGSCLDLPEDASVIRGARVDYHFVAGERRVCAGTVAAGDRFVDWAESQLGLAVGSSGRLTYYWLSPEDAAAFVGEEEFEHSGYAWRGVAVATEPLFVHELTHLVEVQWRQGGRPPRFFIEGLAVSMEDFTGDRPRYVTVDPRPYLLDTTRDGYAGFYSVAGGFVAYLLGIYGGEALRELYRRLERRRTHRGIETAFRRAYGVSLDRVVEEYRRSVNSEECPENALNLPLRPVCAAPEEPWSGDERWEFAVEPRCDREDAVGGAVGDQPAQIRVTRTLTIAEDGEYHLRFASPSPGAAIFVPCGPCPWLEREIGIDGYNGRALSLTAGTYAVEVYLEESDRAGDGVLVVLERV